MKTAKIHRRLMIRINLFIWALLLLTGLPAKAQPDGEYVGAPAFAPLRLPTILKVILVQFADVKWDQYKNSSGIWVPYNLTHKKSDFEALLASLGTYNFKNSDDEFVHGSLRDYFKEMSRGSFDFTVTVLNTADGNGYPIWV